MVWVLLGWVRLMDHSISDYGQYHHGIFLLRKEMVWADGRRERRVKWRKRWCQYGIPIRQDIQTSGREVGMRCTREGDGSGDYGDQRRNTAWWWSPIGLELTPRLGILFQYVEQTWEMMEGMESELKELTRRVESESKRATVFPRDPKEIPFYPRLLNLIQYPIPPSHFLPSLSLTKTSNRFWGAYQYSWSIQRSTLAIGYDFYRSK